MAAEPSRHEREFNLEQIAIPEPAAAPSGLVVVEDNTAEARPDESFASPGTDIFEARESGVRSYCRHFDRVFDTADGCFIRTEDGDELLDFLSGCSSLNYGHNDPDMREALVQHLARGGLAHGLDLYTTTKRDFIESFRNRILEPRAMDHRLQFAGPTGANAVEAALKLARKVTGRTNVIAFTNGYHGVTIGALAATGNRYNRAAAGVPLGGIFRAFYDGYLGDGIDTAEVLDRMLSDRSSGIDAPAAILLETVQGEGGLNVASPHWIRRIAEIARRNECLLIVDDIQAGCGRTGTFFRFEGMGVMPDIITLSKSLSGFGLPMSVVLIRPQHDRWGPGEHNGTFRGNTHAFVTARVAIEKYWSDGRFQADVARRSVVLSERLSVIARHVPGARRKGRGMMQGIDVGSGELASRICQECFRRGLILETSGSSGQVVKVLAPLVIEGHHLHRGLDILEAATVSVLPERRFASL